MHYRAISNTVSHLFLVAKKEMLVALKIVSSLATTSVAIFSLGTAIRILCLG